MGNKVVSEEVIRTLCHFLEEKGEVYFPVSAGVYGAVMGTYFKAKKNNGLFKPGLVANILAKISRNYASITSFVLWLGVDNVEVSVGVEKGKKSIFPKILLIIHPCSNHTIKWDELKATAFHSPFI